jgi:RNA methyltransferase, TrmH family
VERAHQRPRRGGGEGVVAASERRWLVDGTNVVGSRPDGWWRDRPAAFRRLVDALSVLAEAGDEVTVVFDGRPAPGLAPGDHGGVSVRWAERRGRDAADDVVVSLVAADEDPAGLVVVTSDRGLAARVAALGAPVEGAASFRRRRLGEEASGTDRGPPT